MTLTVLNPATKEPITVLEQAGVEETDAAVARAREARAPENGALSVNSNSSVRVSTPFEGFKQSGFGRELGMHALAGYSEVKNVYISTD